MLRKLVISLIASVTIFIMTPVLASPSSFAIILNDKEVHISLDAQYFYHVPLTQESDDTIEIIQLPVGGQLYFEHSDNRKILVDSVHRQLPIAQLKAIIYEPIKKYWLENNDDAFVWELGKQGVGKYVYLLIPLEKDLNGMLTVLQNDKVKGADEQYVILPFKTFLKFVANFRYSSFHSIYFDVSPLLVKGELFYLEGLQKIRPYTPKGGHITLNELDKLGLLFYKTEFPREERNQAPFKLALHVEDKVYHVFMNLSSLDCYNKEGEDICEDAAGSGGGDARIEGSRKSGKGKYRMMHHRNPNMQFFLDSEILYEKVQNLCRKISKIKKP